MAMDPANTTIPGVHSNATTLVAALQGAAKRINEEHGADLLPECPLKGSEWSAILYGLAALFYTS